MCESLPKYSWNRDIQINRLLFREHCFLFWKDYVDIHALVSHGIGIPTALAAARAIDAKFLPEISLRALQFFGDGTLVRVPVGMQRDLTRWTQSGGFG